MLSGMGGARVKVRLLGLVSNFFLARVIGAPPSLHCPTPLVTKQP